MIKFKYPKNKKRPIEFEDINAGELFNHRFEGHSWDESIFVKMSHSKVKDDEFQAFSFTTMSVERISIIGSRFRIVTANPVEIVSYSETV